MQAVKIYNSDYTKGRRDQDSCLEKWYKLTVSKDKIGVIQVDRDISNTSFSQIKVLFMGNVRYGLYLII